MQTGQILAELRKTRRLSQLDLALRADVSSRHLSFIETGRSQASSQMLKRLAMELELSCRDTNRLLLSAGYAPAFSETDLDSESMAPVRQALEGMLFDPTGERFTVTNTYSTNQYGEVGLALGDTPLIQPTEVADAQDLAAIAAVEATIPFEPIPASVRPKCNAYSQDAAKSP